MAHEVSHTTAVASSQLQKVMQLAGWQINYIDLDLTTDHPTVEIEVRRDDGRTLFAKVDSLGRASIETFQRTRSLGMSSSTKGRRPLSPQVDDLFMGRSCFPGARSMLRGFTSYLSDNAISPIALPNMRAAWASVMSGPLRIGSAA